MHDPFSSATLGPLTAEDLDLWADRVDEVVTGLHMSDKGDVARVAARLDLSLQPAGPAAQAAFLWGLASRLGLPEVRTWVVCFECEFT